MKNLMLLLVGLSATLFTNAQNVSMGLTGGIGQSWLDANHDIVNGYGNKEMHVSYSAGVKTVYSFNPHWGISSDLRVSSEGGTFSNHNDDPTEIVYRSYYIRHAMQGLYFFGDLGNRVRPKIGVGPSVAIYAGGNTKVRDGNESLEPARAKDIFKTWDAGVMGSAGVNFRMMKNVWLNTDFSYYHGLTNAYDLEDGNKFKNRSLTFNIGLLMGCDFTHASLKKNK